MLARRIYSASARTAAPRWCGERAGAVVPPRIHTASARATAPRGCERAGTAVGDAEWDASADGDRAGTVGTADPGDWARAADTTP